MPQLIALTGPDRGKSYPILPPACRIGREPRLEVPIAEPRASRVHLEIVCTDGQYMLHDLKSKNGTLVNNAPATTHALKEGDQIQIGEYRFAFSMQDPATTKPSEGRYHDSVIVSNQAPIGAMPALGSGGMARRNEAAGEAFETIELSEPLNILRSDGETSVSIPRGKIDPDATGRAVKSLRALFAIVRAAAEAKTSTELWNALTEGLLAALEADRVTPVLVEGKKGWKVAERADSGKAKAGPNFNKVAVSRTIVDYALRTRRSVLTAPRSDERFGHAKSIDEQGITSALCVPMLARDQILGLLYADRLGGVSFTREDQELLTAASLMAGPAMSNLQRLEDALNKKERLLDELKSQHHMLGSSPKMREVAQFIDRAAPTNSVVLVLGESGTGKELVARATHYRSQRSDAAFIVVNCAALSESLIESELFGHAKGAFTGATSDRAGRFEMAHEGTIFLDEIGELSNNCQTKLLRVLEQGELSRVGEGRVRKVDVRVLAATNRDLQGEVKAGRFREDLFYRLNVLSISLPPLRERGGDIRLLLEHYLETAAARSARPRMEFSEEALAVLSFYRWPGNVRELRNLCERMAVLAPNDIVGVADLPAECRQAPVREDSAELAMPIELGSPEDALEVEARTAAYAAAARPAASEPAAQGKGEPLAVKLVDIERNHILKTLENADNNKKLAAERLGIDRSTLYAKLRAYGIMS